jgi:hypothetical protein
MEVPMDPIKDFLEIIKLARAQIHRNLVLFPLLAPESGDPDYLTLEEALKAEKTVKENMPGQQGWMPPGTCITLWAVGSRPTRYIFLVF